MNPLAIDKAKARLEKARSWLERMKTSPTLTEFDEAWSEFLSAASRVVFALEAGARGNPKSRQWYGARKERDRRDPLLRYIIQARNEDEHGLGPVLHIQRGQVSIGPPDRGVLVDKITMTNGQLNVDLSGMKPGETWSIGATEPYVRLVPIFDDRYRELFDPPNEHLGQPIEDKTPIGIASLALTYYEGLVSDAAKLV